MRSVAVAVIAIVVVALLVPNALVVDLGTFCLCMGWGSGRVGGRDVAGWVGGIYSISTLSTLRPKDSDALPF